MISLEVCANSAASALAAQEGGAARIELCSNLAEGGITSSYGEIFIARKRLTIPIYVLIRPRAGDFLYSDLEFEVMQADIKACAELGCDGIVIGLLKQDGMIDYERCLQLVRLAESHKLGLTFHRAFDVCADQNRTLEQIIDLGFERILTSGGRNTALEGAEQISTLIRNAGNRISIMPGGGINEENIAELIRLTGAREYHASCRTRVPTKMKNLDINVQLSDLPEDFIEQTNASRVKNLINNAAVK